MKKLTPALVGAILALALMVWAADLRKPAAEEAGSASPPAGACPNAAPAFTDPLSAPHWNGWGVDPAQSRFQPAAMAGLAAADVPRLEAQVGVRIPRGNFRLRAADRHRRAGVHRQPSWKSLFARCEHRLHVLGVRRRRPGARGHYAWTDSGGMDGLCRRPTRQSSCRGCSDRQGFVDDAGRRSSGGADHRRADARRHNSVRAGLLDRRGSGHQSEIFLLQLPRQRRRARGIDRKGAVEELHRGRGAAGPAPRAAPACS